jgi:hypothetical protein
LILTKGWHEPFLFILIMNELTSQIQDYLSWCMLFAEEILLVDGIKKGCAKLEL